MYLNHFGLREAPFELTSNPRFLFLTPQHREAIANVHYGLLSAKPVTLMIGEAGTGKTTLLRRALSADACRHVRSASLDNPALTRAEFLQALARAFGLSPRAEASKTDLLEELVRFLTARREAGEITALIVDEAQRLSDELLEEVRLLANLENEEAKLLPVVLAGQPELADRLNQAALTQLKQRIALRCEIAPFELPETASYIAARIRAAGGEATGMFTREAVMLVHQVARGVARTINVLCDNALLSAFAAGGRAVTRRIVEEVARDFDLRLPAALQTPAALELEASAPTRDRRRRGPTEPAPTWMERRRLASAAAGGPARRFRSFGS